MMFYNDKKLMNVICEISEIKSMKVAVKSSLQSGIVVGTAAAVGGLLLGPRGIAIGSILGGLGTSFAMEGQFKPVPEILKNDLTEKQKNELMKAVRNLLTAKNIMTLSMLITEKGVLEALVKLIRNLLKTLNYDL
ncbi:GSCOCG00001207001-RA-CDS [Cotesia congregata]|uniref:Uncharacterized protein n=1 Tax=Cotesia congregata TaxID=51543 RepID=A0A8J2HH77_COTCN|nr:GSCOCG00001207001-RA-CDS [Cotesia congregata]CAG5097457.1 Protein of unknown function [Cotesia congregata]